MLASREPARATGFLARRREAEPIKRIVEPATDLGTSERDRNRSAVFDDLGHAIPRRFIASSTRCDGAYRVSPVSATLRTVCTSTSHSAASCLTVRLSTLRQRSRESLTGTLRSAGRLPAASRS